MIHNCFIILAMHPTVQTVPNGSQWLPMVSNGSQWFQWFPTVSNRFQWIPMDPNVFTILQMIPRVRYSSSALTIFQNLYRFTQHLRIRFRISNGSKGGTRLQMLCRLAQVFRCIYWIPSIPKDQKGALPPPPQLFDKRVP